MPGPNTNPYASQSASGYNDSPPVDDGTEVEANRVTWAKIKAKLADPIKTLVDAINTQSATAFGKSINTDNDERNTVGGIIAFTSSELTIASGVVTQTRAHHTIDTESDAASDDLNRLANANADAGAIVYLRQESSARAVTVKHQGGAGDGQFVLNNSSDVTIGANGVLVVMRVGTSWLQISSSGGSADVSVPRSYLAGLGLSNDTDTAHDIAIATGIARNSDDTETLAISSILTKQIDVAWAVGDDAGGIDTGSVAADTWYHVHAIKRTDTGVVDALFSTSATSPTMPTDYDKSRRIGAVLTDGSANIMGFTQEGDHFLWDDPPLDINSTTLGTSVASFTLSVPLGVKVWAEYNWQLNGAEDGKRIYIKSPDANDEAPADGTAPLSMAQSNIDFTGQNVTRTNTSSQINARSSAANTDIDIATLGWYDRRGKDA